MKMDLLKIIKKEAPLHYFRIIGVQEAKDTTTPRQEHFGIVLAHKEQHVRKYAHQKLNKQKEYTAFVAQKVVSEDNITKLFSKENPTKIYGEGISSVYNPQSAK